MSSITKNILLFTACYVVVSLKLLTAQCFVSPGNPIAGSSNVGVLETKTWRAMMLYKHNKLADYYQGTKNIGPGFIESANYNFISATLAYGLFEKMTIEGEVGYFINKTEQYQNSNSSSGRGLANAVISTKYLLYNNFESNSNLSAAIGVSIPFATEPQVIDGVQLPIDLQPSTGNFGLIAQSFYIKEFPNISMRFFWVNRAEFGLNDNTLGYRFGNAYHSSVFIARHLYFPWTDITKDFTAILQFRYQYNDYDIRYGEIIDYSGGQKFFIAPQLNYNPKEVWNISVIGDFPLYQKYNGIQLGYKYSFALVITKDIGHK